MGQLNNIITGFKNLLTGKETPQEKKRLSICSKCPHLKKSKRCGKCGCYVPAKVKAPQASCPIKKW